MESGGFWLIIFIIVLLAAGLFIWLYYYYKRTPTSSTNTNTMNFPTDFIKHVPVELVMFTKEPSETIQRMIDINSDYASRHAYPFQHIIMSLETKAKLNNNTDYGGYGFGFEHVCRKLLELSKTEASKASTVNGNTSPTARYVLVLDHETLIVNHGLTLSPLVYLVNRAPFGFVRSVRAHKNQAHEDIGLNCFLVDLNHPQAQSLLWIGVNHGASGFRKQLFKTLYDHPAEELHNGASSKVLEAGYPLTYENFTVFHENNFNSPDNHFIRWFPFIDHRAVDKVVRELTKRHRNCGLFQEIQRGTIWAPFHAIVDRTLPPMTDSITVESNGSTKCTIPKRLVQNFEHLLLPGALVPSSSRFRLLNPDFAHKLTTTRDNQRFIRKHYDVGVLNSFNMLIPGAFRSDFWRYLYLYKKGGVYADIKLHPVAPLNALWERPADVILVRDPKGYYNAFMGAKPGARLMKKCIELCLHNIQERFYGASALAVTGPWVVGEAVNKLYGELSIGYNETVDGIILVLDRIHDKHILAHEVFLPGTREPFMYTRCPNTFELTSNTDDMFLATGRPHYQILWQSRQIYRDLPNETA